ncbi:MAG: hypothetical protein WC273_03015 [Dehalococcoidia bacterium]
MTSMMPPTRGYWERWAEQSLGWKPAIEFLQPFGRDYPERFAPLEPLRLELGALRGVEVPPVSWLYATWLRLGFVGPDDLSSITVETYYPRTAPNLREITERPVHLRGLELTDDSRVVLHVEDGGLYREARAAAAAGLDRARQMLAADPAMTPAGDTFQPVIDIAYLDGTASEGAVIQAIDPYRTIDLGEVTPTHLMLGRITRRPETHYAFFDVFAEVPMRGAQRGGYRS